MKTRSNQLRPNFLDKFIEAIVYWGPLFLGATGIIGAFRLSMVIVRRSFPPVWKVIPNELADELPVTVPELFHIEDGRPLPVPSQAKGQYVISLD